MHPTSPLEGEPPVTMVMSIVAQIANGLGIRSIKDMPSLWKHEFGDQWTIYTNGHDIPIDHDAVAIPPYNVLAYHYGLPVMLCGPYEGVTLGEGSEIELVQALSQELLRVTRSGSSIVTT